MEFNSIRYILMDIEGTTSDIHFVKNVMFPYSKEALPQFLETHEADPQVQEIMKDTSLSELLTWIEADVKEPRLKKLQGMIWKEAFETGAFQAPLYEDVLPAWKKWTQMGLGLGIYSSGSVTAQKMFFGHTIHGNLLSFLKNHFDLDIGGKKESSSYDKIARSLALDPKEILFLSDVAEELDAAQSAGFQVAHIVRPGTEESHFPPASDFSQLAITS